MTLTSLWRQVRTNKDLQPYLSIPAQHCVPGCVFMYGVRRNAWHATMVSYWYFGSAYCPTRELVEQAAERDRRQGSHLWYVELPAIVLKRGSHSLVLVQPSSDKPFADYREQDAIDLSIGALAEAVRLGCKGVEIWEQSPPQGRWTEPYRILDSSSNGAAWRLSWHATGRTYDTSELALLIQGISIAIRAQA